jgi:hypothetical protein
MGKEQKTLIKRSLKLLIKKLDSGACDNITEEQAEKLIQAFKLIIEVEKEIKYDINRNSGYIGGDIINWKLYFKHILLFKQERKDK